MKVQLVVCKDRKLGLKNFPCVVADENLLVALNIHLESKKNASSEYQVHVNLVQRFTCENFRHLTFDVTYFTYAINKLLTLTIPRRYVQKLTKQLQQFDSY